MPRRIDRAHGLKPAFGAGLVVLALLAAAAVSFPPAATAETPMRVWPSQQHPDRQLVLPHPCTCRAQGHDFQLGESACIRTSDGPRRAVCGMELNNTSWQVTGETCPES
ncbi:hypothetical protein QNA08_13580 [Chelatococcus sp. SYSU_G07232]|uniref:Uncharacterized protein n=1 Tax=Chelatococcus albus TaxID=3047466 RepID=A0ABT7AKY6_9HYPH|nr:hypothetical protein [Chelatococcus sp. SYSU_G07232]MDJ1159266.1 hypothetical protein [Chelatococcus sp. SYSU_G07232]